MFTSHPSPCLFSSHLPYYLVPKGLRNKRAKIIYVFRNPKDVLASMYHFQKSSVTLETPKDSDTFLEKFLAGKVGHSLWLDHVEGWCTHKDDFNIFFLSYEEMKKDLRSSVLKICNFLGKELSEREVDDVVDKATFDNMKMDSRANYTFLSSDHIDFSKGDFLRKGTIWIQNIVSLILHEGHRNGTENVALINGASWLEYNIFHVDFPSHPSPHLFTSHFPYYLVLKGLQNRRAKVGHILLTCEMSVELPAFCSFSSNRINTILTIHVGSMDNCSIITSTVEEMEPQDESLYKYKGFYFITDLTPPETLDSLDSFEIRDDDTFIITYPKSGTIWTQNIVSLILYEGHRDGTENITLIDRAPWLEFNIFHVDLPSCPSPRVICSHLPYYLVPKGLQNKKAKIIYVLRNPKDVLVSDYHFHKMTVSVETPKDFDTFLKRFLAGKVVCSSWLDHVEGWYSHKSDFNILFLSYEEMKKDLRSSVLKICNFLGKKLTGKEVDDVVDKATFDNMKVDSRANYTFMPPDVLDFSKGNFLRKGTIGDWKNIMTVAQSERFDCVFKERMEKLPFKFCWDIQEDPQPISSSAEENNDSFIFKEPN
ncbi:hypothetical protein E2320_020047 [Naja naja]|nr:hypothetical protein E2320_020047 [Naja naja]